jgi:hypothetical protein
MTTNSHAFMGALAVVAAMIVALPVAKAIDAATLSPSPTIKVNRAAKGDQLATQRPAARQLPAQPARKPPANPSSQKERILDGCDPLFSPVTTPSMAHVSGRCVG